MRITKIRRLDRRRRWLARVPAGAERPMLKLVAAGVLDEACRFGRARATFRGFAVSAHHLCRLGVVDARLLVVLQCDGEVMPLETYMVEVAQAPAMVDAG